MSEPRKFIAGDSVSWTRSIPEYPASEGWELNYRMVSVGQSHTISATTDGDEYQVSLTSADTSSWAAGEYELVAMVSNGSDRYTVDRLRVVVKPNPASDSYDPRSFEEKLLAELEKLLQGKATKDKLTVTVEGQTIGRYTWAELMAAEKYYRGRVNSQRRLERERRTGRKSNRVLVKMP
ncbi:hypothetical protein [Microbulbifer thermotolerans]|uniref:hypothetical protein n=1 Tax=Microbulbifer thermotolerans TaxID=252514 RepID=UPI00224B91C3|nr:hypothetical protein [Microbulbifer thermotolerans]MCX2780418.1 hypothetical protein [Microbulbifer thermotolerans]MCX2805910.1 hypothetical protein [Microbulbifer thermotolerans]